MSDTLSNNMSDTVSRMAAMPVGESPAPRAGDRRQRRRERDQVRAQLLRSALALSEGRPFSELTVDQIAGAAGISRTAFYNHFHDKQELLLAALEEVAEEIRKTTETWWSRDGPPAERVRDAVAAIVSVYSEHVDLLRIVIEASTYDDEIWRIWVGVVDRFVAAMAERVRTEQRDGMIPRSLEPDQTSEALVWLIERCCYVQLARDGRTAEEVVGALAPVWTAALYPGVIPAEQLQPGLLGSRGPWGMAENDWPEPGAGGTGAPR